MTADSTCTWQCWHGQLHCPPAGPGPEVRRLQQRVDGVHTAQRRRLRLVVNQVCTVNLHGSKLVRWPPLDPCRCKARGAQRFADVQLATCCRWQHLAGGGGSCAVGLQRGLPHCIHAGLPRLFHAPERRRACRSSAAVQTLLCSRPPLLCKIHKSPLVIQAAIGAHGGGSRPAAKSWPSAAFLSTWAPRRRSAVLVSSGETAEAEIAEAAAWCLLICHCQLTALGFLLPRRCLIRG